MTSASGSSTASAFRRAFSTATSAGSPRSISSTAGTTTSKARPSRSRIALLWGDPDARISFEARALELGEPDPDLALRRRGRVRAVNHVLPDLDREIPADRARVRLERVGGPDQLTRGDDRRVALEHGREQWPRGDELDELTEER